MNEVVEYICNQVLLNLPVLMGIINVRRIQKDFLVDYMLPYNEVSKFSYYIIPKFTINENNINDVINEISSIILSINKENLHTKCCKHYFPNRVYKVENAICQSEEDINRKFGCQSQKKQ